MEKKVGLKCGGLGKKIESKSENYRWQKKVPKNEMQTKRVWGLEIEPLSGVRSFLRYFFLTASEHVGSCVNEHPDNPSL